MDTARAASYMDTALTLSLSLISPGGTYKPRVYAFCEFCGFCVRYKSIV